MLLRKKEEIEKWLNQCEIKNYELIEDNKYGYVVNVNDGVILFSRNLSSLSVKFNEVYGIFNCSFNELTSLEGCPKIVHGDFYCYGNKLESLKGCPEIVNGNFSFGNNLISSLKYCPEIIHHNFYASDNNLTIEGLKYLPKNIKSKIEIKDNKKLSNLQNIENIEELKEKLEEIFKIKEEQEKISKSIITKKKKNINKI